ncbi:hypothetical protein DPEC_G00363720 [Dallia pectoralis]|nr:hypothetical protein DPEC_G00363720 [Dallia pectoralis]
MVQPSNATQDVRWTSALAVKNPCLINIASTMYRKIRDKVAKVTTCSNAYPTLIEALWVLFMRSNSSPAATAATEASAPSSANAAVSKPSTPEALAVMVHLAVQMLNLETDTDMGACKDIKAMYSRTCYAEAEFILVTAIAGGLFGVNVELRVDGSSYHVINQHYQGLWAHGSIGYDGSNWYVTGDTVNGHQVSTPQEPRTVNCYHTGTLGAYIRLNNLKLDKVPSDNYCGFHTVAALLGGPQFGSPCAHGARKTLVQKTTEYMLSNQAVDGIQTYLEINQIYTREDLTSLLMQDNRWLSTEEVTFMLNAYGKLSTMITEHSYPIFDPNRTHFEPVTHV